MPSALQQLMLHSSDKAMGTPAACIYTTMTYGQHKNTEIFAVFEPDLFYYKQ
jgi:hypothetical protein